MSDTPFMWKYRGWAEDKKSAFVYLSVYKAEEQGEVWRPYQSVPAAHCAAQGSDTQNTSQVCAALLQTAKLISVW